MKLLLTSGGIKNPTLNDALVGLLGKAIEESSALCIPTAIYPFSVGPTMAYRFITGTGTNPVCELGWKSLGVLELTALPSVERDVWTKTVQETDALLVFGGDTLYLAYWMRQSGLVDLFPSLREMVYVGISAGSMVMTPRVGEDFISWKPPTGGDEALGLVDFSIFPHLDNPKLPDNAMAAAEKWAAGIGNPAYAIDDDTAIQVIDGAVEVVSGGHWRHFTSST